MGRPRGSGRLSVEARFHAKYVIDGGCWLWTAATMANGYAVFAVDAPERGHYKSVLAHRWSYEAVFGLIPDGLEVDHLCRVRHCVNPDHLEVVSHRVNQQRMSAAQAHCRRAGHPYTPENTYTNPKGQRVCRACRRERDRALRRSPMANRPSTLPVEGPEQITALAASIGGQG